MKTMTSMWTLLFSAGLSLCALASPGGFLPYQEEDAPAKEAEEEEEGEQWFAVCGGDVYTGTGAVLRGTTILAKDGVIEDIGPDVYVPEEATRLDATGLRIYPGLVAVSSYGLLGSSGDYEDTVDPFNYRMVLGLAGGLTATSQGGTALKLKRNEIEGVVLREKYLSSQSFSTRNPSSKRGLKEKLAKADEYLRQYRQWEEDKKQDEELKEPSKKGVDPGALAILRGEVLAKFTANERTDLLGIARLAQQYGFRPVIEGCMEGWTVAGELGRAGAYAIVTPRTRSAKDERLVHEAGSSIENAAILHAHGVQVAVVPSNKSIDLGGIVGRDIMHLPIEAGFAVRGGLPEDAALEAITLTPARILGVGHRIGSIEVGKDCDLIVTDGDVLHYESFVQYAVVEGKVSYRKSDELYFAHIRPLPEVEEEPEEEGEAETDEGEAEEGDGDG